MRITDSFIERVLSGASTPEEKKQLAAFFRDNPGKLTQYMTEESWLDFVRKSDSVESQQDIPSMKMREVIEARIGKSDVRSPEPQTFPHDRSTLSPAPLPPSQDLPDESRLVRPFIVRLGRVAAAAAIILTAGFSVFYWIKTGHDKQRLPGTTLAGSEDTKSLHPLETIRNTTNRTQLYPLPDGSTVKLASLSELSYDKTFASRKRDFFLQGQGIFSVKKNPTLPFIVHSQGIATTALGTVFSVDDREQTFSIVRLYSGRVVVRKEMPNGSGLKDASPKTTPADAFRDIYLTPGQQLVLNKGNYTAKVSTAEPDHQKADLASTHAKRVFPKQLQFTREPLSEIFSQLQTAYGATISYDSTRMKNMDFTGIFNHDKETLDSFLGVLCDLNGLTLIKRKANHFLIREK